MLFFLGYSLVSWNDDNHLLQLFLFHSHVESVVNGFFGISSISCFFFSYYIPSLVSNLEKLLGRVINCYSCLKIMFRWYLKSWRRGWGKKKTLTSKWHRRLTMWLTRLVVHLLRNIKNLEGGPRERQREREGLKVTFLSFLNLGWVNQCCGGIWKGGGREWCWESRTKGHWP